MKVTSVDEMRNMDKRAITEFGVKEILLMENAGESLYYLIREKVGIKGKKFVFFCGSGNNGGDGLVAARKIATSGGIVKIFILSSPGKFRGSSRINYLIAKKSGIEIKRAKNINSIKREIENSDVVVDAIFGTGLNREVKGIYRDVINTINNSGKTIFSVDIPSGVNGNTGEIMGISVDSHYTITFGLPKYGNLLYPGAGKSKKLFVTHISFPESIYEDNKIKVEINTPLQLPERKEDSHKGDFGDVLFIAGCNNYYGAPFLSSYSFLKAGGGYGRLATVKSVIESVSTRGNEIVFHPMDETSDGSISLSNIEKICEISEKVDLLVVGPGLSLNEETKELVREILKNVDKPILLDGDGITAVSEKIEILAERKHPTIVTPHPGEMARLTKKSVSEIKKEKLNTLREFIKSKNVYTVLKGKNSLIGLLDGKIFINTSGNSGMAVAGSGDVLTGCIAAMYGIGFNIENSLRMGVFLHGMAGDMASEKIGKDGMTPTDIMNFLPEATKKLRENYEEIVKKYVPEVL